MPIDDAQLAEVSLLCSMYSVPDELVFSEPYDLDRLINLDTKYVAEYVTNFEFTLFLKTVEDANVELRFYLPFNYPAVPLSVMARCELLDGEDMKEFSATLRQFINSLSLHQPQVTEVISWVQENVAHYLDSTKTKALALSSKKQSSNRKRIKMVRYWIHSHHIYSKIKRKDIIAMTHQAKLTGFLVSGKPGFICVEGERSQVQEFWDQIRTWSWRKLTLVHEESEVLVLQNHDANDAEKEFRRFGPVKEQDFNAKKSGYSGWHMDMGLFNEFLIEHHSESMFRVITGLEGD